MGVTPYRQVVHAKLLPPPLTTGLVVRDRVVARMSPLPRFALLSAMPGFGKTALVRQWVDTLDMPVAWVSLDVLDREPVTFWAHVLCALQSVCSQVDDEPARLLGERGAEDALFLAALLAQLAETQGRRVLVLDGLPAQLPQPVLDGLALVVERLGETLHLVVTTRTDPALPLARWRSFGWLVDLRENDLRLTDDEAQALGASVDTSIRSARDLVILNRRVDGWPIAFHMALLARPLSTTAPDPEDDLLVGTDRLLANYLVTELLDAMGGQERDVALGLSVLEQFDPDLCLALVGEEGKAVVGRLLGRGVFLSIVDPRSGMMRFHELFRELLELELGWRDPFRRVELHRRAAKLWTERGDLMSAYHHLAEIGETDAARQLLVDPALEFVDRGDLEELRRFARKVPNTTDVAHPALALDLATVTLFADGTCAAERWAGRAATLIGQRGDPEDGNDLLAQLHDLRCGIALLQADLSAAVAGIEARGARAGATRSSRIEGRFPITAARVMLAARRQAEADMWIARAERIDGPEILTAVTVPTLRAWHEWMFGNLESAVGLLEGAVRWLAEHRVGAHHYAFDTLISGGWCQLSIGNVAEASRLADRAVTDADTLGNAWNRLQAGYLSARIAVVTGDPHQALRIIDDLRESISLESCRPFADRLLATEIEALAASGQPAEAARVLATLRPGPRTSILQARFGRLAEREADALLAGRDSWPTTERLEAELLLAVRRPSGKPTDELVALVAECGNTGWVLPFLGHGPRVEQLLRAARLDELHPRLGRTLAYLAPKGPARLDECAGIRLTTREQALLEMLPTHLSYAGMGERLFLSVHTIKSNLKVLYRKLGATNRAEAVDAGRDAGLL